ncbi:Lipoamide acyltransferase [Grifola frondosa]|uniref:Dihydrolipoamide acetyltransferase component of pyruvate dehydrogenase complex n=1 Tax=Grifola frondosa TaxID=5627 RepID=A0A1C7MQA8_GRIFR|nr:Lipoamide acyltransferase [Grifola frondosa]
MRFFLPRHSLVSHLHASHPSSAVHKVLKRFTLADIGEGITECEIIRWSVKPASPVQAFDALCEVQSDKASVELTSPFDGVVKELLVKEGNVAKVGEGLCTIEVDEEISGDAQTSGVKPIVPPSQNGSCASVAQADGKEEAAPTRRPHPLDPNVPQPILSSAMDVLATPSVRHFARKNGVDLAALAPGSGKGGRIEKSDVEGFLNESQTVVHNAPTPTAVKAASEADIPVELSRTRYNMWKAMEKSLDIPHFGVSTSLDLTALHDFLPVLNAHIPQAYQPPSDRPQPSLMSGPFSVPRLRLPPSIPHRRLPPTLSVRPHADISIALSTPTGLYTPTIQRVDTHSIYSLASQLKHLSYLGRQIPSGLTPAEMPKRGGTVTVSNVGGIANVEYASPVLVPGAVSP